MVSKGNEDILLSGCLQLLPEQIVSLSSPGGDESVMPSRRRINSFPLNCASDTFDFDLALITDVVRTMIQIFFDVDFALVCLHR